MDMINVRKATEGDHGGVAAVHLMQNNGSVRIFGSFDSDLVDSYSKFRKGFFTMGCKDKQCPCKLADTASVGLELMMD